MAVDIANFKTCAGCIGDYVNTMTLVEGWCALPSRVIGGLAALLEILVGLAFLIGFSLLYGLGGIVRDCSPPDADDLQYPSTFGYELAWIGFRSLANAIFCNTRIGTIRELMIMQLELRKEARDLRAIKVAFVQEIQATCEDYGPVIRQAAEHAAQNIRTARDGALGALNNAAQERGKEALRHAQDWTTQVRLVAASASGGMLNQYDRARYQADRAQHYAHRAEAVAKKMDAVPAKTAPTKGEPDSPYPVLL